jgi:hypothetical protein
LSEHPQSAQAIFPNIVFGPYIVTSIGNLNTVIKYIE